LTRALVARTHGLWVLLYIVHGGKMNTLPRRRVYALWGVFVLFLVVLLVLVWSALPLRVRASELSDGFGPFRSGVFDYCSMRADDYTYCNRSERNGHSVLTCTAEWRTGICPSKWGTNRFLATVFEKRMAETGSGDCRISYQYQPKANAQYAPGLQKLQIFYSWENSWMETSYCSSNIQCEGAEWSSVASNPEILGSCNVKSVVKALGVTIEN